MVPGLRSRLSMRSLISTQKSKSMSSPLLDKLFRASLCQDQGLGAVRRHGTDERVLALHLDRPDARGGQPVDVAETSLREGGRGRGFKMLCEGGGEEAPSATQPTPTCRPAVEAAAATWGLTPRAAGSCALGQEGGAGHAAT
eukprot:9476537-Pyramimonas_sp.AAC.1